MIKLIVSDLDGTLLNSKQQISDRTLRAIKQIQRKGLRLLINTEQNYFDAKKLLDAYDISCDIACFGGSCIFDTSGHQLHASYIPTKRIPEMLRIFGSCRTFYEIHMILAKTSSQEMSTQKTSKRFTCTNTEPISSIQTIRRYGIISHNLLNSTDSQTHQ